MKSYNRNAVLLAALLVIVMVANIIPTGVYAAEASITDQNITPEMLERQAKDLDNQIEKLKEEAQNLRAQAQALRNQAQTTKPTDGNHNTFSDVPADAWYAEAVNAISEGGLLTGYSDGLFHPNDTVTVGQFATILCRICSIETSNDNFVPRGGYEKPLNWAHTAMSNLRSSGTAIFALDPFYADYRVTRGEVLSSLQCLAYYTPSYHENGDFDKPMLQISEKVWTKNDIPDWDYLTPSYDRRFERDYVAINPSGIVNAYNLGITKGIDDKGTCNSLGTITRAELCQMLYNMGITSKDTVDIGYNNPPIPNY